MPTQKIIPGRTDAGSGQKAVRNRAVGRNVRGRTITGRLGQGCDYSGRSVLMVCVDSIKSYYNDIKR